jgi:hypothetical protein
MPGAYLISFDLVALFARERFETGRFSASFAVSKEPNVFKGQIQAMVETP